MKFNRCSPFYLYVKFTFFLYFILILAQAQAQAQVPIDSIAVYNQLSANDSLSIAQRIHYTNRVIALSNNKSTIKFKLEALNRKSNLYTKEKDYLNATLTAKTLLKESEKYKDSNSILLAYAKLASFSSANDSLINALDYYNKHKEISIKLKDSATAIRDLRLMASIQRNIALLHESEASAVEGLAILDKLPFNKTTIEARIGLYNHLGLVYKDLRIYDRALDYYDKILKLTEDPRLTIIVLNNKANVYRNRNDFHSAVNEFTKVYKKSLELKDPKLIARALDNLGFSKSKLNLPDALNNMEEGLSIREQEQNKIELFTSFNHLSQYYANQDTKKALEYANKAYEMALNINSDAYKLEALSRLIELDTDPNVMAYKRLSDSITEADLQKTNKYASMKYDLSKEQKLTEEAKFQKEKEKNKKMLFQFIAIFGGIISILLYFILKLRHKKEKLEQIYSTEKRLSKKVHDEVANDVYHVMAKLQSENKEKDDVILDELEHIYNKTRDISKENSEINVKTNYNELIQDLLLSYRNENVNVITKNLSMVDWSKLKDMYKTTLYRVLQELMTNMRKHSKASIVVISFAQDKNKIHIEYKDNGVGCELNFKGGLLNTENRMESINGSITFESSLNKGFKASIII